MISGVVHPENLAKLSKDEMQKILFTLLEHVNRSFTYNTGPVELANRILTEFIEADLLELKGGCGSCNACSNTIQHKDKPKKAGKIIQFPIKN